MCYVYSKCSRNEFVDNGNNELVSRGCIKKLLASGDSRLRL